MSATVERPKRRRPVPVEDHRTGSPAEQLRIDLERFRRTGIPFERAWAIAWGRVKWPHGTAERHSFQAILGVQRALWRDAYEGTGDNRRARATRALIDLA